MKIYVVYTKDRDSGGINNIIYAGNDVVRAANFANVFITNVECTDVEVWIDGKLSLEEDEAFVAIV